MASFSEKNLKIAVTGGIGSGKSTVMQIISELGYKTIDLDKVYKDLLSDEKFVNGISNLLGIEPVVKNGRVTLDKSAVSKKVFNDKNALEKLNAYTHPQILAEAFRQGGNGITFYEVPLLFECDLINLFDKTIVVLRDKDVRAESAAKRDGKSTEEIFERINNQFDYDNTDLSLHIIIRNDGDLSELTNKVKWAINEIKER